ncbi:MAG TPA: sigma-54 factor interaction domain-containing protein, partial [Polyangiaceae bacterium LLY-WYZ-15_(1-7)]|nr:sigma-54 factor interaction domain-containing protein [Polyangiaceae bacterium LLY-WYZ-15_(1-7)]
MDVPGGPESGDAKQRFGEMWGASPAMAEAFSLLERVAPTDLGVLLLGETGTGKELAARGLHGASGRGEGPFVVVDCGAIQPNLIESELFGHEKAAFTGADRLRVGAFEAADGGTVFLDEIGELPLSLQPKLLRVLERREVQRLGSSSPRTVDVRLVAATHRDLAGMVRDGGFREDLY